MIAQNEERLSEKPRRTSEKLIGGWQDEGYMS